MNGIGNRLSAQDEKIARDNAIQNFAKKAEIFGRWPGTHSLGEEFQTKKKEK